ncbi:hypothetical protein T4B_3192 [Trichinella pseudospiralis]|uniref:Uncharacterized protein n=1 Tax=Trichinella pseudospiralis TaxID=6337 RepID=A0A0V1GMI8_TRIPS|nr:hypothetical protein T4B_3192 [Trichinella pseudospiralis]
MAESLPHDDNVTNAKMLTEEMMVIINVEKSVMLLSEQYDVNLRRKWVPFPRRLLKSSYLLNFCSIWNIPRKFKNYWQLQSLNGATKTGAYLALLFHEKSRFIAMPLGGTPFAISECMHYAVAYQ